MKVVYLTIRKQIERAIEGAKASGRTIDHIELTSYETSELAAELTWCPIIKDGDHYMGVRIKVADKAQYL